jgi:hypothetical protein
MTPNETTRQLSAAGLAVLLCASGCLSSSYEIPASELARLAALSEAERGREVRGLQVLNASAPPATTMEPALEDEAPYGYPAPAAAVIVIDSSHHTHEPHSSAVAPPASAPQARQRAVVTTSTAHAAPGNAGATPAAPSGDGRHHADPSAADTDSDDAGQVALLVAAVVVVVAGSVIVAAAIEGPRYDGWLRLDPDQPLHFRTASGAWAETPLSKLDPQLAHEMGFALVSDDDHPVTRLRRAALDRAGWSCGLALGASALHTSGATGAWGFAGRLEFGGFPTAGFGILVGLGLMEVHPESVTGQRLFLELQGYPLALGRFHLGVYGQGGRAFGAHQAADAAWFAGIGALLQFELSTRLALTLRSGLALMPSAPGRNLTPEVLAGVAVY